MKVVFKLMIFSIMLNFAVGIMLAVIPAFDIGNTGGLTYDSSFSNDFTGGMNQTIQPAGLLEDRGDAIYRVLDMIGLGFIHKIITAVDKYMFGFVLMLEGMFSGPMGAELSGFIFGILRVMITIGYILGAWVLWTGRSLDD